MAAVIALVALVAGCHVLDKSMSEHVQIYEHANSPFGTLDRQALARGEAAGRTRVLDPRSTETYPLKARSGADGRLCFETVIRTNSVDSAATAADNVRKRYTTPRYRYLYHRSLSEITDGTPWPDHASSDAFEVEIGEVTLEKGACEWRSGKQRCLTDMRNVPATFCAGTPKPPADSTLLGIAVVFPRDDARDNYLILWKLVGAAVDHPDASP